MTAKEYFQELNRYRVDPNETDVSLLEKHLPLLRSLDQIDKSSVALFDMSTLKYRFLTDRFRFLLGFNADEAREAGMDFFFRLMNTYDVTQFLDTSIRSFEFLTSRPIEERRQYKTCQDFRIRRADDSWVRLLQQIIVLELDRLGNVWLVLMVNDESPLKDMDVPSRRYMEDTKTGLRVLFPESEATAQSPLSPRELEILGLISQGYPSRDIADYLGISICTVNNHRQKILMKTQTVNSAEAVRLAGDLDLI